MIDDIMHTREDSCPNPREKTKVGYHATEGLLCELLVLLKRTPIK